MTEEPRVPTSVGVIQADRDAAADWWMTQDGCAGVEHLREGFEDDTAIVQAFARHRLSSTPALDERERLRAALELSDAFIRETHPAQVAILNRNADALTIRSGDAG